ncbi:hypothetical protein BC943DRAFT_126747 [Umbelopsis sp. AD052]|nr:hypothetical protein BC943DRAFT_126747 [Umbelopsis sp. AD052]
MQSVQHGHYVKSLYRRLLSEAGLFFDSRARTFMVNRIRHRFRECQRLNDLDRIKTKIIEGRKYLHSIERANINDQKCVMRILRAAYGRTGKVRHYILMPYIEPNPDPSVRTPEPFYPHIPHTAPPAPMCPPLQILITQLQNKKLEPELPEPRYKPLHLGRKANLLWAWRSKLLAKAQVPLPLEILNELESNATLPDLTIDGGPRWQLMYGPRQRKYLRERNEQVIFLAHLDPQASLVPRNKLQRRLPLPMSPYSNPFSTVSPYSTAYMLNLIDDDENDEIEEKHLTELKPRQIRRYYQRLLSEIPCMTGLSSREMLWDANQKYTLFTSLASVNSPRRILSSDELPCEDVMEQSIASSGNKKKQSKSKHNKKHAL